MREGQVRPLGGVRRPWGWPTGGGEEDERAKRGKVMARGRKK